MNNAQRFLAAHDGLAATLALDHPILRSMASKLARYGSLTVAQLDFAAKLAVEVRNPPPAERHVPAPIGDDVTVRGRVVSVKWHYSRFGSMLKMTVKVETPGGSWLAWGSVPRAFPGLDVKGATVEFVANMQGGSDPHFAFFKRPRRARIVARADAVAA